MPKSSSASSVAEQQPHRPSSKKNTAWFGIAIAMSGLMLYTLSQSVCMYAPSSTRKEMDRKSSSPVSLNAHPSTPFSYKKGRSIDEQLRARNLTRRPPRAYVTLIASPEYDIGAQILLCGLRRYDPDTPIFVLVDESILDKAMDNTIPSLAYYERIMQVPVITVSNPAPAGVKNETRVGTYTKLQLWNTDHLADIIVYLDADTLVTNAKVKSLFGYLENDENKERSINFAVVGNRNYLNTGIFVTQPSTRLYAQLKHRLDTGDYKKMAASPTEQDLLVTHFAKSNQTIFLDDNFNYRPLHQATFKPEAVIVHYIGNPKPWTAFLGHESTVEGLETDEKRFIRPWSRLLYQCEMELFFSVCHDLETATQQVGAASNENDNDSRNCPKRVLEGKFP